eukprot:5248004-Prorocentrum_lima.AAC.1
MTLRATRANSQARQAKTSLTGHKKGPTAKAGATTEAGPSTSHMAQQDTEGTSNSYIEQMFHSELNKVDAHH